VDEAAKKTALRMVPYGLYIGGATEGGRVHAFLLSWLTQCSFKPPLVAIGLRADGTAHPMILETGVFSVNLLDQDQKPLAADFLKTAVLQDGKLSGHGYARGATGCPILEEAAAWLECRVLHHAPLGDHTLVVGEVVEAGVRRKAESLAHAHTGWHYAG